MKIRGLQIRIIIFCSVLLTGCGTLLQPPLAVSDARIGEETQTSLELKNLPDPAQPVVAAVFQFRDQTGQYKANGGFSTAVTQGGTNILLKAMKDSRWFVPIERENVNNLLQERKIIRSTRQQLGLNEPLNPLLYASIILEGGIVSYDTNILTGGAGVRYFGIGGSEQYRQDRVTVYLRVVSVKTGEVLKVVYTSKKVLSQSVDGGLFQYVSFKRLLEVETGFTYNEPGELAVREAIEKAVQTLVLEGIIDGLWNPFDPDEKEGEAIKNYQEELTATAKTDLLGKTVQNRRSKIGVKAASSSVLYNGDFPGAQVRNGFEFGVHITPKPAFAYGFNFGTARMTAADFYDENVNYLEMVGTYRLLPYDVFTPYMTGGFGGIAEKGGFFNVTKILPKASIGGGLEYLLNQKVGLHLGLDYHYILGDNLDNAKQGKYNDAYWRGNAGVTVYFGEKVRGERRFAY